VGVSSSFVRQERTTNIINLSSNTNCFNFTLTNFNDTNTNRTLTGSGGNWSVLVFVSIPKNASVSKAVMKVTGIRSNYTLFLQPESEGKDTWLREADPNTAYGNDDEIIVGTEGGGTSCRGLIEFNLSNISSNSIITLANMSLYNGGTDTGGTINVSRVTAAWTENTATWNNAHTNHADAIEDANSGASMWLDFNITDLTQKWVNNSMPNYGIMLRGYENGNTNFARFKSSDSISNYPKMNISYYTDLYSPKIDISNDGDYEWSKLENWEGQENIPDFSSEINVFLLSCTPDSNGLCQMPINISSNNGTLDVHDLIVKYEYNVSELYRVSDMKWDDYKNIVIDSVYDKVKHINDSGLKAPQPINITGYFVSGNSCEVND